MPQNSLPYLVWLIPFRGMKRTHRDRRACEEALGVCRRLGFDEDVSANVVYLALAALETGAIEFLNEAVELLRDGGQALGYNQRSVPSIIRVALESEFAAARPGRESQGQ